MLYMRFEFIGLSLLFAVSSISALAEMVALPTTEIRKALTDSILFKHQSQFLFRSVITNLILCCGAHFIEVNQYEM